MSEIKFTPGERDTICHKTQLYCQAILETRLESVAEAIYEIEKPTQYSRK